MDLLHSGSFDAFGIVSSDADFTPLVMRLRGQNMRVFGFGAQHAPKPFVNACSTFLYLDEPDDAVNGKAEHAAVGTPKTTMQLRQDTALLSLLRGVAETAKGDDGWSLLGMVGNYIANRGPFDARNYGYPNLSSLIEATEAFEKSRGRTAQDSVEVQRIHIQRPAHFACFRQLMDRRERGVQQGVERAAIGR